MFRNILNGFKTAVVDLLLAACGIKPDDFDLYRVEKIGDRRIVKGEVAIFANSGAEDIDRKLTEKLLIGEAGQKRSPGLFAGDQVEFVGGDSDLAEQFFLEEISERGRMIGGETEVFVHMKPTHARPVKFGICNKCAEHFVLAWCGGKDHAGFIGKLSIGRPFLGKSSHGLTDKFGSSLAHSGTVRIDFHLQGVDFSA